MLNLRQKFNHRRTPACRVQDPVNGHAAGLLAAIALAGTAAAANAIAARQAKPRYPDRLWPTSRTIGRKAAAL